MAKKNKTGSVTDTLMDRLRDLLGKLAPLLNPGPLQPAPIPVRHNDRK